MSGFDLVLVDDTTKLRPLHVLDIGVPATREAFAIRSLFLLGFDTNEIATMFNSREERIVKQLHAAPAPQKLEAVL